METYFGFYSIDRKSGGVHSDVIYVLFICFICNFDSLCILYSEKEMAVGCAACCKHVFLFMCRPCPFNLSSAVLPCDLIWRETDRKAEIRYAGIGEDAGTAGSFFDFH